MRSIPPPPKFSVGLPGLLLCETTKKRRYVSQPEADKELRRQRQASGPLAPNRSYECGDCGDWHLTSLDAKKWAEQCRCDFEPVMVAPLSGQDGRWAQPKELRRLVARPGHWRPHHKTADDPFGLLVAVKFVDPRRVVAAVMNVHGSQPAHHVITAAITSNLWSAYVSDMGAKFEWTLGPVMSSATYQKFGFLTIGDWKVKVA